MSSRLGVRIVLSRNHLHQKARADARLVVDLVRLPFIRSPAFAKILPVMRPTTCVRAPSDFVSMVLIPSIFILCNCDQDVDVCHCTAFVCVTSDPPVLNAWLGGWEALHDLHVRH